MRACVTQSGSANSVAVIDTATNTVVAILPVGILPVRIAMRAVPTIATLIAQVQVLNLNVGQKGSLNSKLRAAQNSLSRGNSIAAIGQIRAFINEVQALTHSGRLDSATANELIATAQDIIGSIR